MLRSDLCDFSDAYIVAKGHIAVTAPDDTRRNKSIAFKNDAPFTNCISKINGVLIDNAEDLEVVMPMYNLLEYSKIYRKKQVVCEIITEMNHVIISVLTLLIQNIFNTRQVLQEILIILLLVMRVIMQTNWVKIGLKLLFR